MIIMDSINYVFLVSTLIISMSTITNSIAVMSVDLGSEWLKVAIVKPGVPMEIALNRQSKRKTPFVISLSTNERLYGEPAQTVSIKQPEDAYIYIMHLVGKKYDSPAVQLYKKRFPFYLLSKDSERDTVVFQGENGVQYAVEELLAMTLNFTKHMAESFADHAMKDVVLTVPAFFNQAERRAVLHAAKMVDLNVLQLMNDNTAVALNYGIFRAATFNSTQTHVMFYDMGASHTTATIVSYSTVKVKDRGYVETVPQLLVKGVGFDTQLGGLEMDMRLRDYFVQAFRENHKTTKDITESPRAMAKLLKEAKRVRQVLSANTDHKAQIEGLFEEIDFKLLVTRAEFEKICYDLFDHVKQPVIMALKAAAMTMDDIEAVVLMGGATRVPKVQENLLEVVKKESLSRTINADEAAALGAVYKAADLTAGFKVKRFIVKDLNLFPVDVQFERAASTEDGTVKIINRNLYHRLNPLPQKKIMTFNKKPSDFQFNVSYGDLTFLSDYLRQTLSLDDISYVNLTGVDAIHEKYAKATPKGVKAYFNLDESGLLHVDKVEAHFEKTPELIEEESQSTFAKLGSKLSSFFGSSKSEDDAIEEGKEDDSVSEKKKEENKAEDEASSKPEEQKQTKNEENNEKVDDSTGNPDNSTLANTTRTNNITEQTKPKEPVFVKEEVKFSYHEKDIPNFAPEKLKVSKKKLDELEARDQLKFATEKAYNNLESYIYDFKTNLEEENVKAVSSQKEREKLQEVFADASSWLDEEGFDATEEILKRKLKYLQESASDLQLRLDESIERPKAIASILQSINLTGMFLDSIKTLPDVKEIYTEKDIKDFEKIVSEGKEWLLTNWRIQNESDPTKKPVLLAKDIVTQQGKIDRELMYLVNKAKFHVPKPKPKSNITESNGTKTTNSSSERDVPNKSQPAEEKTEASDTSTEKKGKTNGKSEKHHEKKQGKKTSKQHIEDNEPEVLQLGDDKTDATSTNTKDDTLDHHDPIEL